MKAFAGIFIVFSLIASASFSGLDLGSLATFIHILEHEHDHLSDHHNHVNPRQNSLEKKAVKIVHRHAADGSDESEPHDHTVDLGTSFVAMYKEPIYLSRDFVERAHDIPQYTQNRVPSPDLDGLYRPPKS